ncbi:MAG: hypothetical protein KF767_18075 [Bdellovibrionaceae bacterium]|nr:hypothetical protein [Pseudobdellovibrionaceae bacterium]
MGNWGRFVFVFVLSLATAVLMQNCKPVLQLKDISIEADSKSLAQLGFGGEGYEGKIYLALANQSCADSTKVDARIEVREGTAQYLRRDCQDLAVPETLSALPDATAFQFEHDSRRFELEYVISEGVGVKTSGVTLGAYAPARREYGLGSTYGLQAVPLGANHILVAQAHFPSVETQGEVVGSVRLFERQGFKLVETHKLQVDLPGVDVDYVDPLVNFAPLGENRAVLFMTSYNDSGKGLQTLIVERSGTKIAAVRAGPWFPATGRGVSGTPVDAGRVVVAYENETQVEYRVLDARDPAKVIMGAALTSPAEALPLAKGAALNVPAFLATTNPHVFRVVRENEGVAGTSGQLGQFELTVDGNTLTGRTPSILEVGADARYPVVVGSEKKGILIAQVDHEHIDQALVWTPIIDGQVQSRRFLSEGNQTGEPVGLVSMAGSRSLFVNDLAILRLPEMADDRMWMFDPVAGRVRPMNLYFKHNFSMGTGRLFSSGPFIVYTHQEAGQARIGMISVPENLDE